MKVNRRPVRGESWDRGPLFTCYFWENDNSTGRQTQVITGKKWNWVCPSERKSEKRGRENTIRSLGVPGSDGLFHRSSNYGNEERWSQKNKSHNFRLKCMNICFCCGAVHLSVQPARTETPLWEWWSLNLLCQNKMNLNENGRMQSYVLGQRSWAWSEGNE